jgi:hypothetical protein
MMTAKLCIGANTEKATLTPNKLPIEPQITPGFAVSGVILILSGVVYTLVGIKNKWLHVFISAAYLASVSVTVLVLYVMNPPISNAVQGAYVVAAVMTGLILGGAAIVFTEMTEGLGCLLGGFCFSMWLLVLQPGGLLTATSSKAIFIASFTLAGFSTSFSHYTRPYGLIISISFSGATAVVLGLDCFSRAGLKEFWAYLWALNSNLFPLGATSYPLTRGIRVEIAAIVVIFLAGIVSQMKLWKVIKERREQRAAEKLQDERNMEQEEENVGRRIEDANAQERNQWEAVYGDKDRVKLSSRDSGVGEMDSQNKGAPSTVTTVRRSGSEDNIEMAPMQSPTLTTGAGLVMTNGQEGAITVRVARDPEPEPERDENGNVIAPPSNRNSLVSPRSSIIQKQDGEQTWVVGSDGEARLERRPSRRDVKRKSGPTLSPDVVPLPFKVPEGEAMDDDRSSIATFADEDQEHQHRRSPSKRLSAASALIQRLSRRSLRNSLNRLSSGEGVSTEELVIPVDEDDRASSIAATMDGMSDDEDVRSVRSSLRQAPDTSEAALHPENAAVNADAKPSDEEIKASSRLAVPETTATSKPTSDVTVAADIPKAEAGTEKVEDAGQEKSQPSIQRSLTSSTDPKTADGEALLVVQKTRKAGSVTSAVNSKPASISKDRLPPQLSKVVMSYRTNEWAKHLSTADAPEFEELKMAEYPVEVPSSVTETAAPVNVEELQQTPQNATPPPAPRSVSQTSTQNLQPLTRSSSMKSRVEPSPTAKLSPQDLGRSSSQHSYGPPSAHSNPTARGFRSIPQTYTPRSIVESPKEGNFPPPVNRFVSPQTQAPFGSSPTLMGKRDSMVRTKSNSLYQNHQSLSSTPELSYQYPQYTSGSASRAASRAGSDAGSIYNYPNTNAIMYDDDEEMPLSARRDLIRQSSLMQIANPVPSAMQNSPVPFDSHQPRRSFVAPPPAVREQQMASWRASVHHELHSGVMPGVSIERQRSALWHERQQEEQRKALEERRRGERDSAFDERMRRGDMLDAHREALRKMQAAANKNAHVPS